MRRLAQAGSGGTSPHSSRDATTASCAHRCEIRSMAVKPFRRHSRSRMIVSWFDMPCAERGNRTIRIHTRLASASRRPRTMRRRARHIAESLSASIACCGAVKPCEAGVGSNFSDALLWWRNAKQSAAANSDDRYLAVVEPASLSNLSTSSISRCAVSGSFVAAAISAISCANFSRSTSFAISASP